MASIPAAPLLAAQSLCIGFAKSVQRDSCISTKCDLVTVLKDMVAVVHVVLASKFAIATPWKLNIPWYCQSGTLPEMTWPQLKSLLGLAKSLGGQLMCEAAGLKKLVSGQILDIGLNDGETSLQFCRYATAFVKLLLWHSTLTT